MKFYCGVHQPSDAWRFERSFISINRLNRRVGDFEVKDWVLDSGAFSQVSQHGEFQMTVPEYAAQIRRWSACGNLEAAVSQDYMCEPWILEKTGGTVVSHQWATVERYLQLRELCGDVIMPCLQGQEIEDYSRHIFMYGDDLAPGAWVGVGSVCKRKNESAIQAILESIKRERPDLRLHGFGLKITALVSARVRDLLESADSMAWSFAARFHGAGNDYGHAEKFVNRIETMALQESFEW